MFCYKYNAITFLFLQNLTLLGATAIEDKLQEVSSLFIKYTCKPIDIHVALEHKQHNCQNVAGHHVTRIPQHDL